MHPDVERLITIAKNSGELTEKQKEVILRKAKSLGEDVDEVEVYIEPFLKQTLASPPLPAREKLKKCPNCGAVITDVVMKCPECGYVFSSLDANGSSQKLFEKLNEARSLKTKLQIIESFPIPNSKEDLLEFLLLSRPYVKDVKGRFATAYLKKYSECVGRCQTFFPDDPDFKRFIEQYNEADIIRRKHKRNKRWLFFIIVAGLLIGFSYSLIFKPIKQRIERKELVKAVKRFEDYLEKGDIYKAGCSMEKALLGNPTKVLRLLQSSLDAEYCSFTPAKADSIIHLIFDYSLDDKIGNRDLLDIIKKAANYHFEYNDPNGAGEVLSLYSNKYVNDPNLLYYYAVSNLDYYLTVGSEEGITWIRSLADKMFDDAPSEIKESVMEDIATRIQNTKDFAAFGYVFNQDSVVVSVISGSSAEEKGIMVGDRLLVRDCEERIKLRRVRAREETPYTHVFERDGQQFTTELIYSILPFNWK